MKVPVNKRTWLTTGFLLVALVAVLVVWGCSSTDNNPTAANETQQDVSTTFTAKNPAVQSVMAVQNRHTKSLMADPDVIGTATTLDNGEPAVMVLATSRRAMNALPKTLDGVRVVPRFTDKIVALKGPPPSGDGTDHKAKQTPPIELGTSGGWRYDLANGYCCGGTLGALIQVGGQKRILSNYHVFEADIVSGGNGIVAATGDPVIQPALIDVGCQAGEAQDVATLVVSKSLPNNNVDCSSANIISGMVDETGAILEVGTISSATVAASVGQNVKKSGRTTGLTRTKVDALNATISVAYENECAGGAAFTKTFTGQIILVNRASKFLAGGDSGSLLVEDVDTNPRAVGLLFAGSSQFAVANPIDDVLSFFGATMVGN
jgi:hypothetical protein